MTFLAAAGATVRIPSARAASRRSRLATVTNLCATVQTGPPRQTRGRASPSADGRRGCEHSGCGSRPTAQKVIRRRCPRATLGQEKVQAAIIGRKSRGGSQGSPSRCTWKWQRPRNPKAEIRRQCCPSVTEGVFLSTLCDRRGPFLVPHHPPSDTLPHSPTFHPSPAYYMLPRLLSFFYFSCPFCLYFIIFLRFLIAFSPSYASSFSYFPRSFHLPRHRHCPN